MLVGGGRALGSTDNNHMEHALTLPERFLSGKWIKCYNCTSDVGN